jgi:hypothetical protein
MKTVRTKHPHRKSQQLSQLALSVAQIEAECWELDHDRPDPDQLRFSLERSPRQENL